MPWAYLCVIVSDTVRWLVVSRVALRNRWECFDFGGLGIQNTQLVTRMLFFVLLRVVIDLGVRLFCVHRALNLNWPELLGLIQLTRGAGSLLEYLWFVLRDESRVIFGTLIVLAKIQSSLRLLFAPGVWHGTPFNFWLKLFGKVSWINYFLDCVFC